MDFVFAFLYGTEWEDMIILLSEEDAINESIKHRKTSRYINVNIFAFLYKWRNEKTETNPKKGANQENFH
jgi:hypothetical protein